MQLKNELWGKRSQVLDDGTRYARTTDDTYESHQHAIAARDQIYSVRANRIHMDEKDADLLE